jgi:hypothetical protein
LNLARRASSFVSRLRVANDPGREWVFGNSRKGSQKGLQGFIGSADQRWQNNEGQNDTRAAIILRPIILPVV